MPEAQHLPCQDHPPEPGTGTCITNITVQPSRRLAQGHEHLQSSTSTDITRHPSSAFSPSRKIKCKRPRRFLTFYLSILSGTWQKSRRPTDSTTSRSRSQTTWGKEICFLRVEKLKNNLMWLTSFSWSFEEARFRCWYARRTKAKDRAGGIPKASYEASLQTQGGGSPSSRICQAGKDVKLLFIRHRRGCCPKLVCSLWCRGSAFRRACLSKRNLCENSNGVLEGSGRI